jgi:hypothetical protein
MPKVTLLLIPVVYPRHRACEQSSWASPHGSVANREELRKLVNGHLGLLHFVLHRVLLGLGEHGSSPTLSAHAGVLAADKHHGTHNTHSARAHGVWVGNVNQSSASIARWTQISPLQPGRQQETVSTCCTSSQCQRCLNAS